MIQGSFSISSRCWGGTIFREFISSYGPTKEGLLRLIVLFVDLPIFNLRYWIQEWHPIFIKSSEINPALIVKRLMNCDGSLRRQ